MLRKVDTIIKFVIKMRKLEKNVLIDAWKLKIKGKVFRKWKREREGEKKLARKWCVLDFFSLNFQRLYTQTCVRCIFFDAVCCCVVCTQTYRWIFFDANTNTMFSEKPHPSTQSDWLVIVSCEKRSKSITEWYERNLYNFFLVEWRRHYLPTFWCD